MTDIDFVRHVLATIAYRAGKTMRTAPESFAEYKAGPSTKTPLQIVAHMGDLFDWSLTVVKGTPGWTAAPTTNWNGDVARFFGALKRFDDYLVSGDPIKADLAKLFQGPISDSLTHIGQLAMLRRLHGSPMKGESYMRADIVPGRVGIEQTPPKPEYEFD
ncbi:MAG: hypothetical protein WAU88_03935 [Candidatus Zixiibacteriota bacterium]